MLSVIMATDDELTGLGLRIWNLLDQEELDQETWECLYRFPCDVDPQGADQQVLRVRDLLDKARSQNDREVWTYALGIAASTYYLCCREFHVKPYAVPGVPLPKGHLVRDDRVDNPRTDLHPSRIDPKTAN